MRRQKFVIACLLYPVTGSCKLFSLAFITHLPVSYSASLGPGGGEDTLTFLICPRNKQTHDGKSVPLTPVLLKPRRGKRRRVFLMSLPFDCQKKCFILLSYQLSQEIASLINKVQAKNCYGSLNACSLKLLDIMTPILSGC